jgi:transposase
MRGQENAQDSLYGYFSLEDRVPPNHPLRPLRAIIDVALSELSPLFAEMYSENGRPSIPPEYLLRASMLQVLYTIRSERMLMEQLDYNLLFRWFVGVGINDRVWDHSVFSKNRDRLLDSDVAMMFLDTMIARARAEALLSDEHFTVDGTLIEAWASQKSFQQKNAPSSTPDDPGNATVDFRGEKRTNDTHASTTDPETRLYKKSSGAEAKLAFLGHVIMDNRHGLIVATRFTQATGTAEREAAAEMIEEVIYDRKKTRVTLGADKNYDVKDHIEQLRELGVTPHVAQNTKRRGGSSIDRRTTRHAGYAISQRKRKLVEEIFGWMKTVGPMRKIKQRGLARGGWLFTFTSAVYNAVRIRNHLCEAT